MVMRPMAQEPLTDASISSAIECLLHPQDADDSDMTKAIDTAVRAMKLLKAREPRMMTLEEIKDGESCWFSAGKEFVTRPVICVHREDDARKPYITFVWQFGTFSWEIENYGKTWCCWTARPTDEQWKAVEWDAAD